jgi:hypothetical protein
MDETCRVERPKDACIGVSRKVIVALSEPARSRSVIVAASKSPTGLLDCPPGDSDWIVFCCSDRSGSTFRLASIGRLLWVKASSDSNYPTGLVDWMAADSNAGPGEPSGVRCKTHA